MKRFCFLNFAILLILAIAFSSCRKSRAENIELVVSVNEVDSDYEAEEVPSLADVVAKAKAEGHGWSATEWKIQYRKALLGVKPLVVSKAKLYKRVEDDKSKSIDVEEEKAKLNKLYPNYCQLYKEFVALANESPEGKSVSKEWISKMKTELGVPSL